MRSIILLFVSGCCFGCSQSGEIAVLKTSLRDYEETVVKRSQAVEEKTDEAIVILRDNTASLTAIKTKVESLEASLAKSEPQNGKDGDPASAPNPPAKANTALTPVKVATPGDFSEPETLVELATRLHSQGVSVHMKTREQLEAIDAQMVGTKSQSVQIVNRGANCPDGRCPTNTRTRKGLFGWRR